MEPNPTPQSNVHHLKLVTAQEEVQQDAVELLEDYLLMAKAGRVRGIAIVALKHDETATYGFSHTREKLALLGATDMLMNLLRKELLARASDGDGEPEEDTPSA